MVPDQPQALLVEILPVYPYGQPMRRLYDFTARTSSRSLHRSRWPATLRRVPTQEATLFGPRRPPRFPAERRHWSRLKRG